ncbi:MAG: sigma-70 family RNA polymerase sigma factor [Pseudobdellovibrionaceae bacterium]
MDNADVTALMLKIAQGDQIAFRKLVDGMGQKIFAMAYRFLSGDRAMAEDITQDVLVKIWQHAPRWQANGSASAWISRLTYNACMDVHRARKNKNEEMPEDLAVDDTSHDSLLTSEYRSILLSAMKNLPERQQEALLLTYFHDNSRREVAKNMNTTEKAVEHLIARGLKTLEKYVPANLDGGKNVFLSGTL